MALSAQLAGVVELPPPAAAADEAPAAQSCRFTAVAEACGAPAAIAAPRSADEAQRIDRMLHRAALRAALDAAPAAAAVAWIALLGASWPVALHAGSPAAPAWYAGAALVALAWAALAWQAGKTRRDALREPVLRRAVAAVACGGALALALAPWSVDAAQRSAWLVTFVACGGGAAIAWAALLAPMWRALVPLPMLPFAPLAAAQTAGVAADAAAWIAASCAAGLAALLLAARHREWRRLALRADRQVTRRRLLEAERNVAVQASLDKSRFVAIASHDLRQPVHALGLFGETLNQRLRGAPEEPLVRNVMRAIDGVDRSLSAMLDVSRLDAGTIEPNPQHFLLRDLFRRLHMQFAGQAELAGMGLRFSPGGKSVTSDPQLLERILANLIQNALRNTERGGVVVVARSTATHVNIEVWDTGVGIAAPELPRIFGEFYQVGRSERDRARGLGMGLAIVARLARLLDHSLTVVSRPGRGTMFRVGIRRGGLADIQDVTAAADTLPMTIAEPRMILIVEDEPSIREGLELLLAEWGYGAVSAASLADVPRAVASVSAHVDLILSDLHLGDGPNGIEAVDAVRRQCGTQVPAILITGDTSPEEIRRVTESGHLVLFKPVQPRKLFNMLRGLVA